MQVISRNNFGDHVMLIGEVVDATFDPEKQSLIYHNGRYLSSCPIEKLEQENAKR